MRRLIQQLKNATAAAAIAIAPNLAVANSDNRIEVVKAEVERRDVKFERIDTENFEISASYGQLAIEDFDTSDIVSLRLGYHLHENLFIEASYSQAEGYLTSYEVIVPGTTLVTEDERDYTSWDVSLGFNVLPGETWIFGHAFSSDFYLLFGWGQTEFVGSDWSTLNIGFGYRLYLTDWMAMRFDVRDHIFNRNLFGEDDQTDNVEMSLSASIFF